MRSIHSWMGTLATQKDHFPLSFITFLEVVGGHARYTFMDGYAGYNQIAIA